MMAVGDLRLPGSALAALLIGCVRLYRWATAGWLRPRCRFLPSCSIYALTALRRRSLCRAVALIGWRLLRCQPWGPGGLDPVPVGERACGPAGSRPPPGATLGLQTGQRPP